MFGSVRRVIAVVGCQRSGTTLTGQILGAHPHAVLIDEPDGLYPWFHAAAEGRAEAQGLVRAMLRRAAAKYRDPRGRFSEHGDDLVLSARVGVLVLKAPNLSYDHEKLGTFPVPVSIVYPVRDPRAVTASMARLDHIDFVGNQLRLIDQRPATAAEFRAERQTLANDHESPWVLHATLWKVKSGLAPKFRRSGLPVYQFRYEDLVRDPGAVADLLNGCGLAHGAVPGAFDAVYVGSGPGGTVRTRSIDQAALMSWKTHIDGEKEADVLRVAGPLAKSFGYE
jgi:hypothetical protein